MRKRHMCIVFFLTFFLIICMPKTVFASLEDSVIKETEHISAPFGFSLSDTVKSILSGTKTFSFRALLKWLLDLFFSAMRENKMILFKLTAAGILSGLLAFLRGEENEAFGFASVAIISLMALKCFSYALGAAKETIDSMFLFVSSMFPTLVLVNGAIGGANAAACGTVFVSMQVFIYLCKNIMLPFVSVILTFSVADKLTDAPYFKGFLSLLERGFQWCTGLLLILYGASVALEAHAAGAFDTLAGKTVKYTISSAVPVVGAAFSDSIEMVMVGAKAIKSALGIGGIVGVCCVFAAPLLNMCALGLGFKLAGCFCSVTGEKRVKGAISAVGAAVTRVCAVLFSVSVMFIISLSMLCMLFGGGAF